MSVDPIALLGLPLDANSSFMFGCAQGPAAIRAALHSTSGNDANEAAVNVTPVLDDIGDVRISNERGSQADAQAITDAVRDQLGAGRQIISVGGDHSVTYPILRAVREFHDDLTVVHIDAHPDMYDDLDGNPLSHASPFARALEQGCMTTLVQLGIRTANQHQVDQAARWNVTMLGPRHLDRFDPSALRGPVYLSLDLDVIDALPGPLVGADVVELNPTRDLVDMTAMVGAKLVKEIAGAMLARR